MNINDRLLSLRDYLWVLFDDRITNEDMRIETDKRVKVLTRPMWRIRRTNGRTEKQGFAYYLDTDQWNLTYYAKDRLDADVTLQALRDSLNSGGPRNRWVNRIPGWRFNWQYPQPVVTQVTGGLLVPGQYNIRVSGIDFCDNESAASQNLSVILTAPSTALQVRILRQPFLGSLFKSYNVYVNGHLEASVLHPTAHTTLYPTVTLNQITGVGVGPKEPANSVPIRWKFMRVANYSDYSREDDIVDGIWNAYVTMEVQVYQEKEMPQPEPMIYITGTQNVVQSPTSSSPATPDYLVTMTNTVRIGYG